MVNQNQTGGYLYMIWSDNDSVQIITKDLAGVLQDDLLFYTTIEIRVYS